MAVFISYSHKDKEFVDRLAQNLVLHHTHVWLDRWEINVGESLLERVQSAIKDASALLVVLSRASVKSTWFKKELSAGLMRELDERRVVVLPVLLQKCDIPMFLKEKRYADFSKSFDDGLRDTLEAIASVTSDALGSSESPPYHSDWSVDSGVDEFGLYVQITVVDSSPRLPHCVVTTVRVRGNAAATARFIQLTQAGLSWVAKGAVLMLLSDAVSRQPLHQVLPDEKAQVLTMELTDTARGIAHHVEIESRRVGDDNGKSIIVDLTRKLGDIQRRTAASQREPTPLERERILKILGPSHADRSGGDSSKVKRAKRGAKGGGRAKARAARSTASRKTVRPARRT